MRKKLYTLMVNLYPTLFKKYKLSIEKLKKKQVETLIDVLELSCLNETTLKKIIKKEIK